MPSFSPERWTKVVLQELATVGDVYPLPWRYSVVQYYPINVLGHNKHRIHSTLCRAHFRWTRRTGMLSFIWLAFQVWFVWTSPGFVHSDDSFQASRHLPFDTGTTRPVRLHSDAIAASRKFHGVANALAVCSNPECRAECGAQFCDILKTSAANSRAVHRLSASNREARSWTVVLRVGSSCTEVVLNGIPAFPECFNHRASVRYGNASSPHASRSP